jgi:hypothetical protein
VKNANVTEGGDLKPVVTSSACLKCVGTNTVRRSEMSVPHESTGGKAMASADRQLNEAARDLATAILNAGALKGDARQAVGVKLEQELVRFADLILQRARERPQPNDPA